jgi:hypothetical protein
VLELRLRGARPVQGVIPDFATVSLSWQVVSAPNEILPYDLTRDKGPDAPVLVVMKRKP